MDWQGAVAWSAAALAAAWANRERIWREVARAMRESEKAGGGDRGGESLNRWLEGQALAYLRRQRWLCWVPEWMLRGIIREIAGRGKAEAEAAKC